MKALEFTPDEEAVKENIDTREDIKQEHDKVEQVRRTIKEDIYLD